MRNPLVTIAIPTYKRLGYLKEAVASALQQTYRNIEIVISLDSSPEGLDQEIEKWLKAISSENSLIRCFYSKVNLGLAGNWNFLVDQAKGEYIIIIGDDDRLLPNAIESLVNSVSPGYSVAFSNHFIIDSHGNKLEEETFHNTHKYKRDELNSGLIQNPSYIIWQNSVPISSALIDRAKLLRLRFKEDLNTPEIEFYLRLAEEGGTFCFNTDYLVDYRIHTSSATNSGLKLHYLLMYLIPMKVDQNCEVQKKAFIQKLIITAVNLYIRDGNIKEARKLYECEYYSLKFKLSLKGLVHFVCIQLFPAFAGRILNFFKKSHVSFN